MYYTQRGGGGWGEVSMNIKYGQKAENEYYRQSMNTNYTVCIMIY